MSIIKATQDFINSLKKHCTDEFYQKVTNGIDIIVSNENKWFLNDYLDKNIESIKNKDKINFAISFIENGGVCVSNEGTIFDNVPSFMLFIESKQYLSLQEDIDLTLKWTEYETPFLTL